MVERAAKIEPFLMAVLAKKFETIVNRMTNTLLKSARSGVINTAKDFSCSITDADGNIVSFSDGLPIHSGNSGLVAEVMRDLFEDIRPGDCFLNNSPYYGNTHHADYTTTVPVFYGDEHLFTTIVRAHQADCGNTQPSTYMPFPKDLYEEGALDWPCVRVQRDYKDIEDVIRMGRVRIRVPDQWYGDYLAQVGACRIGERELVALCDKYGMETVRAFLREWQEYGRRSMEAAIRKLPAGKWSHETKHDPLAFVADEGIRIQVDMTIDPQEGSVTLDFTKSDDCVQGGFNMCDATVRAAAIAGVLNNLDASVPRNEGAFNRIRVVTRENCVVGQARHPVCASMATTNVADRTINLVQSAFSKLGENMGMAEGGLGMPASSATVSGTDWRRDGAPYVNQLILGAMGGPAVHGHDGWIGYGIPGTGGAIHMDSVELDEQRFPILFERCELIRDSGGPGRWRGAPGVDCRMRPRHDPGVWTYLSDGHTYPAKGVAGGWPGRRSDVWKYPWKDGMEEKIELTKMSMETLSTGEMLVSESCGGGGFGEPVGRDPKSVRRDVREGYVSAEKAREIYGVVLDLETEMFEVDTEATDELRARMKKDRE